MPFRTSHTASQRDDEPFDLSEIFIAREQQIDLFNIYLNR
jgi:hypothetical protein